MMGLITEAQITQIDVELTNEDVVVYRPVIAIHIIDALYHIIKEQEYDTETEKWAFEPGDTVECELRMLTRSHEARPTLVAVRLYDIELGKYKLISESQIKQIYIEFSYKKNPKLSKGYIPVIAIHIRDMIYYIIKDQQYDVEFQSWAFEPGSTVVCHLEILSQYSDTQQKLVATHLYDIP